MVARMACRACGVVLPGQVGRCPSCGARLGRRRVAAWVGGAAVALAPIVLGVALLHRPRLDPSLKADVHASTAAFRLSSDQKRTEVAGFVDNEGRVPVDVTVRVRGRDYGDNVVADVEVGPIRDLAPGSYRSIRAVLDLTPVKSVSMDVVEVVPSRR
jgi:hypothetical protein